MIPRPTDLTLYAVSATVAGLLVALGPPTEFRLPAGFLLSTAVGITLSRALHPKPLTGLPRFVAAAASAIAACALLGLLLTASPVGLTPTSWATSLVLACLVGALVGTTRGGGRPLNLNFPLRPVRRLSQPGFTLLGVVAIGGAIAISLVSAQQADQESFTALSILASTPSQHHSPDSAVVTVSSHETSRVRFWLVLRYVAQTPRQRSVSLRRLVILAPGSGFSETLPLSMTPIQALLYRVSGGSPSPYREVWLRSANAATSSSTP